MAITQLNMVKELPYLISNMLSLWTCLPLATGILLFGKSFSVLFENKMLVATGMISYEIYLVHAFTLGIIIPSTIAISAFAIISVVLADVLHRLIKKVRNPNGSRYYCNYSYKE